MRVDEYAYYVNKLRQNVGLETWKWRQIVTSQTAYTKYKWPPYATEWNPPPWKFSAHATAHHISCGNMKDVLYMRKIYYMNKIYTKLRHSLPSYVKLKLIGKRLTLLEETWNSVPLSSHKLHNRAFHSLSCSFSYFGVRLSLREPHNCIFAPPLAQRLYSRLVRLYGSADPGTVIISDNMKFVCMSFIDSTLCCNDNNGIFQINADFP